MENIAAYFSGISQKFSETTARKNNSLKTECEKFTKLLCDIFHWTFSELIQIIWWNSTYLVRIPQFMFMKQNLEYKRKVKSCCLNYAIMQPQIMVHFAIWFQMPKCGWFPNLLAAPRSTWSEHPNENLQVLPVQWTFMRKYTINSPK